MNDDKYQGVAKATYYRRLKEWVLTLYDKDGNAYHVSPKHCMKKVEESGHRLTNQVELSGITG